MFNYKNLGLWVAVFSCALCPLNAETINPAAMNPQISVVGTVEALYSNDRANADNGRVNAKEVEVQIQSDIDPFAKANVLFSMADNEFGLEEGYVQIASGPLDLQYKLGKFFSGFGKLNTVHAHTIPFLTDPVFIKNYFGERLADAGASASGLLPLPFYSELSLQLLNDNEASFSTGDAEPAYVVAWKNFFELGSELGLESSLSLAQGRNSTGGDSTLTGVYVQLKKKMSPESYWKLHGEFLGSSRNDAGTFIYTNGGLGALTFRFNREWELGGLAETSQSPASPARASRLALFSSFSPSEFGQYRVQLSRNVDTAGLQSNEARMQYVFVIGPHAVHPY